MLAELRLCLFSPAVAADGKQWLAILGLGICLAGGYFFESRAMGRISSVSAVLISNLEPVMNPVWVALFLPALGEIPGPMAIVGGLMVLITAAIYAIKS